MKKRSPLFADRPAMILNIQRMAFSSTIRSWNSVPVGLIGTRKCTSNERKTSDYQLVYKFPYIVHMRVAARLKIYQTGITLIAAPWAHVAAQQGHLPQELAYSCMVASVLALGTLYYVSFITRRLVGLVGVDKNKKSVKLAHMTFWGGRNDIVVPLGTIVPFTECDTSPRDLYMNLNTYDNNVHLFLSLRFGGVQDLDAFEEIFGKLR